MPKKKEPKKVIPKITSSVIDVTRKYTLHNWSDTLSFEQLVETLYVIGSYLEDPAVVCPEQALIIEQWMSANDMKKFLDAKDRALIVMGEQLEHEMAAKDIMSFPISKHKWH